MFGLQVEQPTVQPESLFHIGSLTVTNAMLMGLFVTLVYFLFSLFISKRIRSIPSKIQTVVEMAVEAFVTLLAQISGSRDKALKLLPLVGTIFLFFGMSNVIGLIPGLTSITYHDVPLFRTPTNDFNMTFSVALAVVIIAQVGSIQTAGFFGHVAKFIKVGHVIRGFKEGIGAGMLAIVDFLIGLLDIISEFAKVISLSLRLFGNMYAGEVLAAVILGALPIILPAPWLGMNILVGFLQAMVFGSLTAAYYTLSTEVEESST